MIHLLLFLVLVLFVLLLVLLVLILPIFLLLSPAPAPLSRGSRALSNYLVPSTGVLFIMKNFLRYVEMTMAIVLLMLMHLTYLLSATD